MFSDQKRYLYLPYLILSCGCAVLIGLLELLFSMHMLHGLSATVFIEWLLYYLLPVIILISLLSHQLWFGVQKYHFRIIYIHPAAFVTILVAVASMGAIFSGNYFLNESMPGFSSVVEKNLFPIGIAYAFSLLLVLLFKKSFIYMVKRSGPENNIIKAVVIVGTDSYAQNLSAEFDRHPEWGIRVMGFLSKTKDDDGLIVSGHPVIGNLESIGSAMNQCIIDMVLITPEDGYGQYVDTILQRCRLEGIDVGSVTNQDIPASPHTTLEQLQDISIWMIKFVDRRPEQLFIKRCLDLVASMTAICLCLPLWILLPILIRKDSPGPILFRQTRIGKHGRRFTMYKFRSMVVDAEKKRSELMHLNEMDGPVFKIKSDPRVTRFGAFLRKTSLDELPQLFNVLKGDLSLVGPRPPLFEEVCKYRPWEKKRLAVMQGITGLWQISGRNDINFDEWIKLDLMFIDQWQVTLDMIILFKTIPAVIFRKGAS
jgi:exopolysaccharide biosynthesis polyprenyl glycosylphosphotransferase